MSIRRPSPGTVPLSWWTGSQISSVGLAGVVVTTALLDANRPIPVSHVSQRVREINSILVGSCSSFLGRKAFLADPALALSSTAALFLSRVPPFCRSTQ